MHNNNNIDIAQSKIEQIAHARQVREKLLVAIQLGDIKQLPALSILLHDFARNDSLDILKRVPENPLRARKNILLSFNTLYSCAAERGGLPAVQSHYMAEKYAILIEHAESDAQCHTLHMNMLGEYIHQVNSMKGDAYSPIVQNALSFIELYFTEDIAIQNIADYTHSHPSHLMRSFKKELNMTIVQYIRQRRLEEAKQFLVQSNLTVTNIATMAGFRDVQHFCRIFKHTESLTPMAYRRQFSSH